MPRVRIEAARLVVDRGWSARRVARHTGFSQSTIVRWANALRKSHQGRGIPTRSSRPRTHAHQLSARAVQAIIGYRLRHRRCAEVLHYTLTRDGCRVSLASVKRTLRRAGLTRYGKRKKRHRYDPRPMPERPGILAQVDTIVGGPHYDRLYVYTMTDVCSRWSFAMPVTRISTHASWKFVRAARENMPFELKLIQSDHGAEFSKWLTKKLEAHDIRHRHSRVRRPTGNAHVERFNGTLQEECLNRVPKTFEAYRKAVPEYLSHYNSRRPHMGIEMQTPAEVMRSY